MERRAGTVLSAGVAKGRSILVAVEPVVLEGALARLIERAEQAEVVQFHGAVHPLDRRYDAAVVSEPGPEGVDAGVVISLPAGGAGEVRVRMDGDTRSAVMGSHAEILELLAQHAAPRT